MGSGDEHGTVPLGMTESGSGAGGRDLHLTPRSIIRSPHPSPGPYADTGQMAESWDVSRRDLCAAVSLISTFSTSEVQIWAVWNGRTLSLTCHSPSGSQTPWALPLCHESTSWEV